LKVEEAAAGDPSVDELVFGLLIPKKTVSVGLFKVQ
jgi:hypothetical protein